MTDWNEPITLTMRRGNAAAVAQALAYANSPHSRNLNTEAEAGKQEIEAALETTNDPA